VSTIAALKEPVENYSSILNLKCKLQVYHKLGEGND
jgi:hypothetical protein